jgi:asparagine synthase (glutamine-hydrolysing)
MCGIVGLYYYTPHPSANLKDEITRATQSLYHRGPDDWGTFLHMGAALGHRRLSIIDIESGRQPMFNEDGSKCIVYNGEIFNYLELREELLEKGHRFRTNSDTETILHAFEQWGEECLHRFIGMFAFAIYDLGSRCLFLARDRLGIKPLFYRDHGDRFLFASEIKGILTQTGISRDIDETAMYAFFNLSYIPYPLTIFKEIRKLPPGHYMNISSSGSSLHQYWDLEFSPDYERTEKDTINEFLHLLEDSVEKRLISEVPLGVFLSGGIDSSVVAALMSKFSNSSVQSYTIGFGGNKGDFKDERKYARLVAGIHKTDHTEYEVQPHIDSVIKPIVAAFDEPFSDDSTIPSYYLYQTARQSITVGLSGLGGDENFAGYERYLGFKMGDYYEKLPSFLGKNLLPGLTEILPDGNLFGLKIDHLKRFLRSGNLSVPDRYLGYLNKFPTKYRNTFFISDFWDSYRDFEKSLIDDFFHSGNAEHTMDKLLYFDIKTYLPEDILACTDRMSMHHSLEVRVPFIDHRVVEYCATIPWQLKLRGLKKKYLLRKGTSNILPRQILNHKKQGFVGPMSAWLRKDLRQYTESILNSESFGKYGLISYSAVKTILDDHFSGKENNESLIWSLVVFQVWVDTYLS